MTYQPLYRGMLYMKPSTSIINRREMSAISYHCSIDVARIGGQAESCPLVGALTWLEVMKARLRYNGKELFLTSEIVRLQEWNDKIGTDETSEVRFYGDDPWPEENTCWIRILDTCYAEIRIRQHLASDGRCLGFVLEADGIFLIGFYSNLGSMFLEVAGTEQISSKIMENFEISKETSEICDYAV